MLDWKHFWSSFRLSDSIDISSMHALDNLSLNNDLSPDLLSEALKQLKHLIKYPTSMIDLNRISEIIDGLSIYFPAKWKDKNYLQNLGLTLNGKATIIDKTEHLINTK